MAGGRHRALVHVSLAEGPGPAHWALAGELGVRCLRYATAAVATSVGWKGCLSLGLSE